MSPRRRGLAFAGFWWGGIGCRFFGLLLSTEQGFLERRLSLGRRFRLLGLRLAFVSVLGGGIGFGWGCGNCGGEGSMVVGGTGDLRLDPCRHFKPLRCRPGRHRTTIVGRTAAARRAYSRDCIMS